MEVGFIDVIPNEQAITLFGQLIDLVVDPTDMQGIAQGCPTIHFIIGSLLKKWPNSRV